ncbi:MAG: hypothetical protein ABI584_00030 [Acidobacteriota bacterium]
MLRFKILPTALFIGAIATAPGGLLAQDVPLKSWSVPNTHTGRQANAIGNASLFVTLAPCRVADTRGNGFSGAYGPPALIASTERVFPMAGQCGIPAGASAVSVNFTTLNSAGPGFLLVWPTGGNEPGASTMNFDIFGIPLNNAALVPLSAGTNMSVKPGVNGTHLIIDVNGYFIDKDSTLPGGNQYFGVVGTVDWDGVEGFGAIYAKNLSSTLAYSIKADISNTVSGSAAIAGRQAATSGANAGVYGKNSSTTATSAGVKGESTSASGYGVLGVVPAGGFALYAQGNSGATGTKSFVEPYPNDPLKVIRYVSLEGREAGTYFRGRARFVGRTARIPVPEDFRAVSDNDNLTVHVTPIGGPASLWVASVDLNEVVLESTHDVEFSYIVHGVRRAFKDFEPIQEGDDFIPGGSTATIPGWLAPDVKRRLIENGTYNPDGSANSKTLERHAQAARVAP